MQHSQENAAGRDTVVAPKPRQRLTSTRLTGIDAARGLALIGLMAVHILADYHEDTGDPTLSFSLFYGHSAALFAVLAGVGLALSTGAAHRHRGLRLRADRVGLAVRAAAIGVVALLLAAIIQPADPEASILLYYAVFFLLALPFLGLGPRALFLCALAFALVGPILMWQMDAVLPEWEESNPGVVELFSEPGAVASQLLLTGTYPALPYMTYLLAGMGIGRLDLGRASVQAWLVGAGAALAVLARTVSTVLLYAAGGYQALLKTPGMSPDDVDEALVFGPDGVPDSSAWWLAIATPHTNTPLALASSLGLAVLALGVFLLVSRRAGRWLLPLYALGAMTLTLYTGHLLALSLGVHEDQPALWYTVHVLTAAVFAVAWSRWMGRGPLERAVSAVVTRAKRLMEARTKPARAAAPPARVP
jgi:uncharacterized membrane protein YeiB